MNRRRHYSLPLGNISTSLRTLAFVSISVLLLSLRSFAADDHAERLCEAILKVDIRDIHSAYQDDEHFRRFQSMMKTADFQNSQQMSSEGGSLGLDIPLASGLLGLDASANSNSANFQTQMSSFENADYSEYADRFPVRNSAPK